MLKNETLPASPPNDATGDDLIGELLTRWTIRLALAAYVGRLIVELTLPADRPDRDCIARRFWTIGCALLWIHVACAYQFYHHWSHASAHEQTERETTAVTGLHWGCGIWINYFVMLLWAGDTARWWVTPKVHRDRPAWLEGLWQFFFAFITFNATVVFKTGTTRWVGAAVTAALAVLCVRRLRMR